MLPLETGARAIVPSILPPGNRRLTIARGLFALSFLPYLLPDETKPQFFRGKSREQVYAERAAARHSQLLGGGRGSLEEFNSLFE